MTTRPGYRVLLKNCDTGEERWVQANGPWTELTHCVWTQGQEANNYIRADWFAIAGDEPFYEPPVVDKPRFVLVCVEHADGTREQLNSEPL
jgi:hypothetical protein